MYSINLAVAPVLATKMAPVLAEGSGFSITSLLSNFGTVMTTWGSLIVFIFGVAAIIAAVYKLVTGLVSQGQKPMSWGTIIGLAVLGGVCTAGGAGNAWKFVSMSIAGGGKETVNDMGTQEGNPNISLDSGVSTVVFMPDANTVIFA